MICARCGRRLTRHEGRIGDQDYCHPDDPTLPDCYEIRCRELSRQHRVSVPLTEEIIRREIDRWQTLLDELERLGD